MSTIAQRRAYTPHWQQINNMVANICGLKPVDESEWIAADLADNTNKNEAWHHVNDRAALALQVNSQNKAGQL